MGRPTYALHTLIVWLSIGGVSVAQEGALDRVKMESARLRESPPPPADKNYSESFEIIRGRLPGFHSAVKDWVESLLPKSRTSLDGGYLHLNPMLNAELRRAGLIDSGDRIENFKLGLMNWPLLSALPCPVVAMMHTTSMITAKVRHGSDWNPEATESAAKTDFGLGRIHAALRRELIGTVLRRCRELGRVPPAEYRRRRE